MDFFKRISFILADRKITPWAASIHISSSVLENIKKGGAPGSEILTRIMWTENANTSWLLNGNGSPFMVDINHSAEELQEWLDLRLNDEDWAVHIIDHPTHPVFVLSMPVSHTFKNDKTISYKAIEVATGPWSSVLLEHCKQATAKTGPMSLLMHDTDSLDCFKKPNDKTQAQASNTHKPVWIVYNIPIPTVEKLRRGQMGTYQLFTGGNVAGGLLNANKPIENTHHKWQCKQTAHQETAAMPSTEPADIILMRTVIGTIEDVCNDESITLTTEQKAKVITAVYRHSYRNSKHTLLDKNLIISLIEVA